MICIPTTSGFSDVDVLSKARRPARMARVGAMMAVFCILLFSSIGIGQHLEHFGLDGKVVTSLATYGGSIYAGTDGEGLYELKYGDSTWTNIGLEGVGIRSVYPHKMGPIGWGITVGTEPSGVAGDTTLTYCWSIYDPTWVPSDSGLDKNTITRITAIDGFPDPTI